METLKKICGHLEDSVLAELGKDKSLVNAKELGEVVDAIKDIKMAIYYASITDAMEEAEYGKDYNENGRMYYGRRRDSRGRYMYTEPDMDMMPREYPHSKMYGGNEGGGYIYYTEMPSARGGRHLRRYYEHKNMGDESKKMEGLEQDLKEISEEITGMVEDMTVSEKQVLRSKLQSIASKI